MNVKVKRFSENAIIPIYAKEGDSGFDVAAVETVVIKPGETKKIPIGLGFEIPNGYELQIRPRSGITTKTKLRVQLGTIDAGYRGEVNVIVDNTNDIKRISLIEKFRKWQAKRRGQYSHKGELHEEGTYVIDIGTRIAQGVIVPVVQASLEEVDRLSESDRGKSGFGSSGIR